MNPSILFILIAISLVTRNEPSWVFFSTSFCVFTALFLNSWSKMSEPFLDYFRQENKDLHVMPDDDKHISSYQCFCRPTISYQDEITGKKVWIHKSSEELCQ